jgi:hypothetical protein
MYAFAKMPLNMLKFDPGNICSGNIGERALQGIVKDHAKKHKGNLILIYLQNNVLYTSMKAMLSNTLRLIYFMSNWCV